MRFSLHLAVGLIFIFAVASPAVAQPPIIGELLNKDGGSNPLADRNDLEGGIWEYKVIERTGDKKTMLIGKIRIKDSAAFDVSGSAKGELLDQAEQDETEQNGEQASGSKLPFGLEKPDLPRLGVLDQIAESNRGGDRIGDINYQRSRNSTSATPKVKFRFDADDSHILTGDANVKYDTRGGGGVWRGTYVEKLPDKKKRRWTFELRFIED